MTRLLPICCVFVYFIFLFLDHVITKEYYHIVSCGFVVFRFGSVSGNVTITKNDVHILKRETMSFQTKDIPTKEQKSIPKILPGMDELLVKVTVNGTVMTTITDYGYLKLFYTFYETSNLQNYPNFFATAIDINAYHDICSHGIAAYYYHPKYVNETSLHTSSIITSQSFQKKVVNKLEYLFELLGKQVTVLYMDCDIILYHSPWPILSAYTSQIADVVAQRDDTLNSGFMLLFPTSITRGFLKAGFHYMLQFNELDQESLIAVIPRFHLLRLFLLPVETFSNGREFFSLHQFHWDMIDDKQIMMHNNYIVGSENKFYRWREMLVYNDDSDEYYSSKERQYVMVDASEARKNNTLYLHQVAVLSRLLNRTFLLPTFSCPVSIALEKCNLCRKDVECFKRFRSLIKMNYREYAFRQHKHTYPDVRNAIINEQIYQIELVSTLNNTEQMKRNNIIPLLKRMTKSNIILSFEWTRSIRVLKIHDLPLLFPKKM